MEAIEPDPADVTPATWDAQGANARDDIGDLLDGRVGGIGTA